MALRTATPTETDAAAAIAGNPDSATTHDWTRGASGLTTLIGPSLKPGNRRVRDPLPSLGVGLDYTTLRQIVAAHSAGASFRTTLTVGRQSLSLRPGEVAKLRDEFGLAVSEAAVGSVYAESFLREAVGAVDIDSLDTSEYEGATVIHDLNEPIGVDQSERYDAVIDGGTLEHVFDVPTALASLMRMTKVGGRIWLINPANNLCGHGFYQFSPEMMFRVFRPEHGFAAERVALVDATFPSVELTSRRVVLDVTDPDIVGDRVMRMSYRPSMLLVQALKTRHLEDPFAARPQQSDYFRLWSDEVQPSSGRRARSAWLPPTARNILLGCREVAKASRLNRRAYMRAR